MSSRLLLRFNAACYSVYRSTYNFPSDWWDSSFLLSSHFYCLLRTFYWSYHFRRNTSVFLLSFFPKILILFVANCLLVVKEIRPSYLDCGILRGRNACLQLYGALLRDKKKINKIRKLREEHGELNYEHRGETLPTRTSKSKFPLNTRYACRIIYRVGDRWP